MHNGLPMGVCSCQINSKIFHESLQSLYIAKSAQIVYQLCALAHIDNVVVDREFSSESHHSYGKE